MTGATPVVHPAVQVLVVDDDPLIRALLAALLQERGYEVTEAPDGEAALAAIDAGEANLVITDRHMPRLDGMGLVRAIRARESKHYVYCIMLTSSGDAASLVSAMEAGVDDFVAKPLQPEELGARLHAAERVLALEAGLAARNRSLAQAYEQLSRELELARSLQVGLLPAPAQIGPLRFEWLFEASSYVGGDTLDFFLLGDSHVAFHLIDVSGHGVSAAMMAFNAQHQLPALCRQVALPRLQRGESPAQAAQAVVAEYNQRFLQMRETSLYLTMLLGIANLATGEAGLVQAGHPPPLLAGAGMDEFRPIGDGGVPVGVLAQAPYEAHELRLEPGSRLVLYSDGVTECTNARGAVFGEQRLGQLLAAQRRATASHCGLALRAALAQWRADEAFEDDVTVLIVEAH